MTSSSGSISAPSLSLTLPPVWDELSVLRQQTEEFLQAQDVGADIVNAMVMVTCELAENALKYGVFVSDSTVAVTITVRKNSITTEVRNPVTDEQAANLARLDWMIQWIRGHQDPFEAYLARLEEVSHQSIDSNESGLGLVRIAYEGESILDFYIDENNVLTVCAVYLT